MPLTQLASPAQSNVSKPVTQLPTKATSTNAQILCTAELDAAEHKSSPQLHVHLHQIPLKFCSR